MYDPPELLKSRWVADGGMPLVLRLYGCRGDDAMKRLFGISTPDVLLSPDDNSGLFELTT